MRIITCDYGRIVYLSPPVRRGPSPVRKILDISSRLQGKSENPTTKKQKKIIKFPTDKETFNEILEEEVSNNQVGA